MEMNDVLLWIPWVKAVLSEVSEAVVLCLQVLQGWSPFTSHRTLNRVASFSSHQFCTSQLPSQLGTLQVSPFESGLALSDSRGSAQFWRSLLGFLLVAFFSVFLSFLLYRLLLVSIWLHVSELSVLMGFYSCSSGRAHLQIFSHRTPKHSFFGEGLYEATLGSP